MNMQTLVLNKHWQPINVISFTKAIRKVFSERAKCLNTTNFNLYSWEDWIHDWSDIKQVFPIPEIIVCTEYAGTGTIRKNLIPKFSRNNIFLRDKNICQFCGKHLPCGDLTMGHLIPRSRGGPTNWTNIVLQCAPCNKKMGNRTPQEANMKLLRKPVIPSLKDLQLTPIANIHRRINKKIYPPSWNQFIDKQKLDKFASYIYWNAELEKD